MRLSSKKQLKKDFQEILIGAIFVGSILQALLLFWTGYNIARCNFWDWCSGLTGLLAVPLLLSVIPSPLVVFLAVLFLRIKELSRKTKIKLIISLVINGFCLAYLLFWFTSCIIFEC